jgi:hypothetical protein
LRTNHKSLPEYDWLNDLLHSGKGRRGQLRPADERWGGGSRRFIRGRYVPASDEVDGFRIPAEAEVSWLSPPEAFSDARFELHRFEYDLFRRF